MININLKYDKAAAFASYNECHSTFNVKCASCETNNFASYKDRERVEGDRTSSDFQKLNHEISVYPQTTF